eukprot:269369-Pelagomonas_calceolata.AAC.1
MARLVELSGGGDHSSPEPMFVHMLHRMPSVPNGRGHGAVQGSLDIPIHTQEDIVESGLSASKSFAQFTELPGWMFDLKGSLAGAVLLLTTSQPFILCST